MRKKIDGRDEFLFKISLYIILTITVAYGLSQIVDNIPSILSSIASFVSITLSICAPFVTGLVIAYVIWPLVFKIKSLLFSRSKKREKLKEKINKEGVNTSKNNDKAKEAVCIIISYIIVIGAIFTLIYVMVSAISKQFIQIDFSSPVELVTEYIEKYQSTFDELSTNIKNMDVPDEVKDKLNGTLKYMTKFVNNMLGGILTSVTGFSKNVLNLFIGLIISFYLIIDRKLFANVWDKTLLLIMPKRARRKTNEFLKEVDVVLSNFIRGQLLDCFIVGVISVIGMLIIGIDFAVVLGIFAGIANVIPYFGPILGMVPAVIVGILSGNPWTALFAVIVLWIIQTLDGNIIAPRIIGESVGLHPVFVMMAIVIGAYIGGFVGMILAVPTAGIVRIILLKLVAKREESELKTEA